MSLELCKFIDLPTILDERGGLTFIEGSNNIPFDIKRIYYLYNVPAASERGAHAHKDLHQVIIALSGSFELILNDGFTKKTFTLNKPNKGLYICPMIWRDLCHFSFDGICLVLASDVYKESDYYREYQPFSMAARQTK